MLCKKCKREIPDVSTFCLFCGADLRPKAKTRQKRPSGQGSVCKTSDKLSRPWIARLPAYKEDNRWVQKSIGRYFTKKEAQTALQEYSSNNVRSDKVNITFSAIFDEWKSLAYKHISKQTQDNYNAAYIKLAALHNLKFRVIRTIDMQQIIDVLSSERQGYDKNGDNIMLPPMSHSSLSKIKALLTQLYDYAAQNDIVNKNYASFISLPKKQKKSKDCFNDIELKKIELAAANGVPFADCILIMCYTGFRISEFLELTPFDYKDGFLHGGKKTDAGRNRAVPVHPKIKSYLDKWVSKGGQTIICKDNGEPYRVDYFRKKCYYPALEQIGVRKLTPHATRHTLATRMAAAGARPEDLQKILGHEDYEVTASTYIHQDIETLKKAISLLI